MPTNEKQTFHKSKNIARELIVCLYTKEKYRWKHISISNWKLNNGKVRDYQRKTSIATDSYTNWECNRWIEFRIHGFFNGWCNNSVQLTFWAAFRWIRRFFFIFSFRHACFITSFGLKANRSCTCFWNWWFFLSRSHYDGSQEFSTHTHTHKLCTCRIDNYIFSTRLTIESSVAVRHACVMFSMHQTNWDSINYRMKNDEMLKSQLIR